MGLDLTEEEPVGHPLEHVSVWIGVQILEARRETPRITVDQLAKTLEWDIPTVHRRCRALATAGLLEEIYENAYQPTPIGHAYVTGALDAEMLPAPPLPNER